MTRASATHVTDKVKLSRHHPARLGARRQQKKQKQAGGRVAALGGVGRGWRPFRTGVVTWWRAGGNCSRRSHAFPAVRSPAQAPARASSTAHVRVGARPAPGHTAIPRVPPSLRAYLPFCGGGRGRVGLGARPTARERANRCGPGREREHGCVHAASPTCFWIHEATCRPHEIGSRLAPTTYSQCTTGSELRSFACAL